MGLRPDLKAFECRHGSKRTGKRIQTMEPEKEKKEVSDFITKRGGEHRQTKETDSGCKVSVSQICRGNAVNKVVAQCGHLVGNAMWY